MSNLAPLSIAPQTLQNYARFVEVRRKKLDDLTLDLHHMTTGCASEAGEALGATKAMWIYSQSLMHKNKEGKTHLENLIEEAGDMLFYLQGLANLLGMSLLDFIVANQQKLILRYPTAYSDADAAARLDKMAADAEEVKRKYDPDAAVKEN